MLLSSPFFFFFFQILFPLPETRIISVALLCFFSDVETLMFCLTEQNKVFMFRFFSINGFFYELSSSFVAVT